MALAPSQSGADQQVRDRRDECDHDACDASYRIVDGVAGHCSQECAHRHRGRAFLNTFRFDHRFCATCFAQLKDVDSPSDHWRNRKQDPVEYAIEQGGKFVDAGGGELVLDATDCEHQKTIDPEQVTGFQSFREHGTIGLVHHETPAGVPNETRRGTICDACGNATLTEADDILRRSNLKLVVQNLLAAGEAVYDEGQTDHELTPAALVDELRRQFDADGELDFALAVGVSIHATGGY